jgi:hypothetical protein
MPKDRHHRGFSEHFMAIVTRGSGSNRALMAKMAGRSSLDKIAFTVFWFF